MPRILAIASLSLVTIAVSASAGDARPNRERGRHRHDVVRRQAVSPTPKLVRSSFAARTAPVVVYLNRGGGQIGGGEDDAANDRSWLVPGRSATVPAWSGGEARWGQVMRCVKDRFSAFNLEITDQRPAQSGYVMAMVGGSPRLLGMGNEVSGVGTQEVEDILLVAAGIEFFKTVGLSRLDPVIDRVQRLQLWPRQRAGVGALCDHCRVFLYPVPLSEHRRRVLRTER